MATSTAADLIERLRVRGETVAVAESCTGGLVASKLTDVPGASHAFEGAVVAYSPDAKRHLLDVDAGVLDEDGPVSVQTTRAMAEGVRDAVSTTWGLATTGYAGPEGGDGVPVGTVFVGVAGPPTTEVARHRFRGDRVQVKQRMANEALRELERIVERA